MPFVDRYGPDSPIVVYQHDDGREVPIPRASAALLGVPLGAPPPPVAPSSPLVAALERNVQPPVPEIEMPAEDVPPPPEVVIPDEEALSKPAPVQVANEPATGMAAKIQQAAQPPPPAEFNPVPAAKAVGTAVAPEVDRSAPSGQAAVLPGVGYVPVTGIVDQNALLTPEQVIAGRAEAAQKKADAELAAFNQRQTERENAEYLAQRQREIDMVRAAEAGQEYRVTVEKLAKTKIDPNRRWHSMSTGKKIGAVFFSLVSGLGSVLKRQGDKNPALDLIMQSIRDDVALQMDERDKLADDVGRRKDAYDQLRQTAKDREAERQGRIAAITQALADDYTAIALQSASDDVKFQAADMANGLAAQSAAAMEEAAKWQAEYQLKVYEAESQAKLRDAQARKYLGMGGGGGSGAGTYSSTYSSIDQIPKKLQSQAVLLPGGGYAIAPSRESKQKADEALASSLVLVDGLDRAMAAVSNMPGLTEKLKAKAGWTSKDAAVIKQELGQLVLNAKEFYKLGAISETDAELINNLGADPSSVQAFFEQTYPKLRNWRRGIVADASTRARQYVGQDIDIEGAVGDEGPGVSVSGDWQKGLESGGTVVTDKSGAPIADAEGKALVPSQGEQKAQVERFIEDARKQVGVGGEGNITPQIVEPKVQKVIKVERAKAEDEVRTQGANIKKWRAEKEKTKDAKKKAALDEKIRLAREALASMKTRVDALDAAKAESEKRAKKARIEAASGAPASEAEVENPFIDEETFSDDVSYVEKARKGLERGKNPARRFE